VDFQKPLCSIALSRNIRQNARLVSPSVTKGKEEEKEGKGRSGGRRDEERCGQDTIPEEPFGSNFIRA